MTLSINALTQKIASSLKTHHLKLVTAESCTGGGLSAWITSIPGSSDWFERGFVTYSNDAKVEMLGVHPETLATFGAVSKETAREMAEGALRHSHADISIAITGIAGPAGGTAQKPVGTVWIACARAHHPTQAHHHLFTGDREAVRSQAIEQAFKILLEVSE